MDAKLFLEEIEDIITEVDLNDWQRQQLTDLYERVRKDGYEAHRIETAGTLKF